MDLVREQGEVIFYDSEKKFGFVQDERGRTRIFAYKSIRRDPILSRAWAFVQKDGFRVPVTFCTSTVVQGGVEDVAPLFGFEPQAIPLEDLREFMQVKAIAPEYGETYGWACRPCGDEIFFRYHDVLPPFVDRWEFLRPGVSIYAGVTLYERKSSGGIEAKACNIELFSAEEIERDRRAFADGSEPEPTYESELLSLEKRSKTLLELIQEGS